MARDSPIGRALIMKDLHRQCLTQGVAHGTHCVRLHAWDRRGADILLVPMKEGPAIFAISHLPKNRRRDAGATETKPATRNHLSKNEFLTFKASTIRIGRG
jgi:hypothetical protein